MLEPPFPKLSGHGDPDFVHEDAIELTSADGLLCRDIVGRQEGNGQARFDETECAMYTPARAAIAVAYGKAISA